MKTHIPIWAGVECTVNRVNDAYFNQCEKNGHLQRTEDIARFAELGIERIRYPFLWEMVASTSIDQLDWSWTDIRALELKRHGLSPIAGLLHHGSGPRSTDLTDPEFPRKFANYARLFAERYPWITDYTPINEPLTTARFSGLYGVWFPHRKSDRDFFQCLINQIKATILGMMEIRKINPSANLVQTEDFGRAQSTPLLQYQADFENHRRWLSFDLLCGRLIPGHPLYSKLRMNGLFDNDLKWIADHPCPPDILGINHYLLSNRFLDDRLEFYPEPFHGGNGLHRYADVGVVDTTAGDLPTPESLFQEIWSRYHIPLAVTEVHLLGPRESQMRWLYEIYQTAGKLKQEGVDFRAVTAWSLLGSYDWNTLCTKNSNFYESGVYDIRAPQPRPTALANMIRTWAQGENYQHPVLEVEGWWKDREGVPFGPPAQIQRKTFSKTTCRPLLVTGSSGTLGRAFIRFCERRKIPYRALSRNDMDICNLSSVQKIIGEINPWAVVNTAGYVRVDQAENDQQKCFQENVDGPKNLATVCASQKINFLHFSSDMVFDGSQPNPYVESHPVSPLNIYGISKAKSEKLVMEAHPDSLIVRTSSFFGPWDEHNFIFAVLRSLETGDSFYVASDVTISPTYVPDLVDICLDLLIDNEKGLLHLTNTGYLTWAELAKLASDIAIKNNYIASPKAGISSHIVPQTATEMKLSAKRPAFSALRSERLQILPSFEDALHRYFKELDVPLLKKKDNRLENSL